MKEENIDNDQAVHVAAANNSIDVMKRLLAHDVNIINERDDGDRTALHVAALHGNQQMVKILLQQPSVDVNLKDDLGLMADEMASNDKIESMIKKHREKSS